MSNGNKIAASRYANTARTILDGAPLAQPPFTVEPFTGGLIPRGRFVTDYHIVDARGRTVWVLTYSGAQMKAHARRRRVANYCAAMNELVA